MDVDAFSKSEHYPNSGEVSKPSMKAIAKRLMGDRSFECPKCHCEQPYFLWEVYQTLTCARCSQIVRIEVVNAAQQVNGQHSIRVRPVADVKKARLDEDALAAFADPERPWSGQHSVFSHLVLVGIAVIVLFLVFFQSFRVTLVENSASKSASNAGEPPSEVDHPINRETMQSAAINLLEFVQASSRFQVPLEGIELSSVQMSLVSEEEPDSDRTLSVCLLVGKQVLVYGDLMQSDEGITIVDESVRCERVGSLADWQVPNERLDSERLLVTVSKALEAPVNIGVGAGKIVALKLGERSEQYEGALLVYADRFSQTMIRLNTMAQEAGVDLMPRPAPRTSTFAVTRTNVGLGSSRGLAAVGDGLGLTARTEPNPEPLGVKAIVRLAWRSVQGGPPQLFLEQIESSPIL